MSFALKSEFEGLCNADTEIIEEDDQYEDFIDDVSHCYGMDDFSLGFTAGASSKASTLNASSRVKNVGIKQSKYNGPVNMDRVNHRIDTAQRRVTASIKESERHLGKQRRVKDRADRATTQQVLDSRTNAILFKLLLNNVISKVNGCISTGKEANVYFAPSSLHGDCAMKIYKTSILVFRDRDRYVNGEFRFRHGYCKSNPRKMVQVWAEKEYRNYKRLEKHNIPCPRAFKLKGHVLLMEFLGVDGWPAPLLKNAPKSVTSEEWQSLYVECIKIMRRIFIECRLVHADFSEYNIIYHRKSLYVIDVSQSVEHEHPRALIFLRMDCTNIIKFFRSKNVNVMSVRQLFDFITTAVLPVSNIDDYLEQVHSEINEKSNQDHIDEEVFKQVFIPRSLDQMDHDNNPQEIKKCLSTYRSMIKHGNNKNKKTVTITDESDNNHNNNNNNEGSDNLNIDNDIDDDIDNDNDINNDINNDDRDKKKKKKKKKKSWQISIRIMKVMMTMTAITTIKKNLLDLLCFQNLYKINCNHEKIPNMNSNNLWGKRMRKKKREKMKAILKKLQLWRKTMVG